MDPSVKRNYSFSYKDPDLCFETGYFGLKVNSSDLTKVKFGLFDDRNNDLSYLEALQRDASDRMQTQLNGEDLIIEISHLKDGGMDSDWNIDSDDYVTHRIVSSNVMRLWESGRIAQHYDFKQLVFKQTHGDVNEDSMNIDKWDITLYIMVWPQSISFTVELLKKDANEEGSSGLLYKTLYVKVKMKAWQKTKIFNISTQNTCEISLLCNFDNLGDTIRKNVNIDCVYMSPRQQLHSKRSERFGCYLLTKGTLIDRSFQGGYTDIRDYDDFRIFIANESDVDLYVPILLFVQQLANPTGLCPIVCDGKYKPTGIHIQLSKNWHNMQMRNYGRFFTFLPVKANRRSKYHIRIPYGFYGTLPTASHSNLSLIGYFGHGGRWEQLAIGCCGETYCMDTDMGCVKQIITDIRTIYIKGEDNKLWQWTDAGWGGDWLKVSDQNKNRLMPFAWKTAYESHGPCLTSMCVDGTPYVETPYVAYGCRNGLTEEFDFTSSELKPGEFIVERKKLEGSPPWFVGFPGQEIHDEKNWGKGFRAIIITRYEAKLNKVEYKTPSISLIGSGKKPQIKSNIRVEIVPPAGVEKYSEGDSVSFDVYLITLPKKAADYYGTNEEFRSHLKLHPESWENIHREAFLNCLKVTVTGGLLKSNYPIIITATSQECIRLAIEGGIGMLPLKFEALKSKKYVLQYQEESGKYEKFSQGVHGSDYWQADFDATLGYSLIFNIPTKETKSPNVWKLEKLDN